MTTDRELRIGAIYIDGLVHYDVRYWRRHGPLFVAEKRYLVLDGRDVGGLITGLLGVRKAMAALGRRDE